MNNLKVNPLAMKELEKIFSGFPETFEKLKRKLGETEETIVDYA